MKIEKIVVGLYQENCYLIIKNNKCIIVDPGDEEEKIIDKIQSLNLTVMAALITHAHFDHIGALKCILDKYNVPLYYNNINNEITYDKLINISEDNYNIEEFKFKVIYTPGHRNDSVTYYFYEDNIMFTGDFLFKGTIGRTDLEYASISDMEKSLKKIKEYDEKIIIYPGHGDKSSLKYENKNNYYLLMGELNNE